MVGDSVSTAPVNRIAYAQRLAAGARSILGRELSPEELTLFQAYVDLLSAWQRTFRLVGSSDREWMVDELLLDSLLFARFLPSPSASVLDLGSGAGIPGIPLKIVLPALRLALLEARRRRTSFLLTAVRELGLSGVAVVSARAETALARNASLRHAFDVVVSRCAGEMAGIVRLAEQFLAPGGRLVISGPPPPPLPIDGSGAWIQVEHPTKRHSRTFFIGDRA